MNISNRIFEDVTYKRRFRDLSGFKVVWNLGEVGYNSKILRVLKAYDLYLCGYLLHMKENIFYLWNEVDYVEEKMLYKLQINLPSIKIIGKIEDKFVEMAGENREIPIFTLSDEDLIMLRLMS